MQKCLSVCAVTAIVSAASSLAAQPVLISQDRYVRANGADEHAIGFGLFDEALLWSQDVPPDFPCVPDSEFASQESEITTGGFFAEGMSREQDGSCLLPGDDRGSGTPNLFEFDFAITAKTTLAISGNVFATIGGFEPPGVPGGSASVSITGPSGSVASWQTGGVNQLSIDFDEELVLGPGTYTVRAWATATPFIQDDGWATYSVVGIFETDPCVADQNGDGILDLTDVQLFVNAFMAGQPQADVDGNGIHDLADVQGFVTVFGAGCPGISTLHN